ncbi:MAG: hypothetical protein O2821_08775 [Chloroflexi bacterium]|nr:hypothetical protein [Chloroflexota bacterium]
MMSFNRTVCILDDGGLFSFELAELLDRHDYSIFQEDDVDQFFTTIADVDPDVIILPSVMPIENQNLLPMLRLLTDNIIAVTVCGEGEFAPDALLQGADICVSQAMPEEELLARLHAVERRLLASTG